MKLNYIITRKFNYQYFLLFKNLFLIYIYNNLTRIYLQKKYLIQKEKYIYISYLSKNIVFNNSNLNILNLEKKIKYFSFNIKNTNNKSSLMFKFFVPSHLKLFLILIF